MEGEFGAWNADKTAFSALEDFILSGGFGVRDDKTGQVFKLDIGRLQHLVA
jgi:hypothetical protein